MSFILLRALLLVLPLVLWLAWWRWIGRRARTGARETPWALLGLCGVFLVLLSLVGSTLFDSGAPGSTYRPTRVDSDGGVVRGGFEE